MKKVIPIIILTIISAFLIFYRFVDIPKYLAFDEVEFTKLALSLNDKPYIPYSQLATGHSTLYFYILLASLKTFGVNTFALRFPSAIFGVLSVIVFYLILEIIYQKSKILNTYYLILTTFIFLSSRWFLNFARFSFEATFLLFLELMSIYFLLKFEETKKAKKYDTELFLLVASGIFCGLAFISYTPGRIFFLLPLGFLLFKKQLNNKTMKQFFIFLIPFIIVIIPLTVSLLHQQDSRIDKLFFWKNHEMTVNEKIVGTANNVKTISLMFFTQGDMNGKHNYPAKPALNPILGLLFIIGLVISIKRWSNNINKLFLVYFLLSIFPSLAIYPWENPNMLRTYTTLPAIVYFVGLAVIFFTDFLNRIIKIKKPKYLILYALYSILILSSFYELRSYFKYQAPVFEHSFEIRYPLDKAIKIKNIYEKSP